MFIGFIMYDKNIVTSLKIQASTEDDAREKLAEHVYTAYNDSGKTTGFTGVVYNVNDMPEI